MGITSKNKYSIQELSETIRMLFQEIESIVNIEETNEDSMDQMGNQVTENEQ